MKKLTTEEFVNRAKSLFGSNYDYSLVNYEHSLKKMKNYNNETEKDFMRKNGYFRVYDCGSMKFEWFR
jgi:hypothetical protein